MSSLQWLGNVSLGLLAAIAWHASPWGLVLVAVPLGLLYLAYREWLAQIVEREQMEDIARTAERDRARRRPRGAPADGRPRGPPRALTASLNRMLEQLERAFGRERHLMREASDELHEPVRAIRRELALLGREDDEDETAARRERARTAALDVVDQVLSEMEAVASAGRPGAVRPAAGRARSRSSTHRRSRAGRCSTTASASRRCPATPCAARRDLGRARAAAHARQRRDPRRAARRRSRCARASVPGGWRFEVADEGGGVPAGHEEAVFEPFYRARRPVPGGPGSASRWCAPSPRRTAARRASSTGPGVGVTFWLRVPA